MIDKSPEGFVEERQRRYSAKELSTLLPFVSAAVAGVLSFPLPFSRLPEATARVEVAALTECEMSV